MHSPHLLRSFLDHHVSYLSGKIGIFPDYPKAGIVFRDVSPLLADADAFKDVVETLCAPYLKALRIEADSPSSPFNPMDLAPTHIAGIESRGFIFGAAMASMLGVGFVPIRKAGAKLPGRLDQESYDLEYGSATLVCQMGTFGANDRVVVVDDLIATGGSALATTKLVERQGAKVIGYGFVIELAGLKGAEKLGPNVHSVFFFD